MSWITLDVDIDIDEFLSNCSSKDIEYIIKCLIEDGHLDKREVEKNKNSPQETEWDNYINKLKHGKYQLTVEEEQLILKICNKIVI